MNYENENVYALDLAAEGEPVAVIGRTGPAVHFGVGFKSKGEWKVQWWQPPEEDGFQSMSFYTENMGEVEIVGFTPLFPPIGFQPKNG